MLAQCLRSLDAQSDADFETVVVDNGSADGSVELLRRDHPRVLCVEAGENLGFAEGVNRGIDAAGGAWIATLNNDTVADPGFIEELRRAARAAPPGVGTIQARLVFKSAPDRTNSTGVVLFANGNARDRDFDAPVRADDAPSDVFCATAGAALYRRAMLDQAVVDKKLTPAERDADGQAEAWTTALPNSGLKSFLAARKGIVAPPPEPPAKTSGACALTDEQRTIARQMGVS